MEKKKTTITSLILLTLCVLTIKSYSQTNAITEFGDNIILYENGTWQYKDGNPFKTPATKNSKSYYKPRGSSFLLKSKKTNMGVWLNSKEWEFTNVTNNVDSEYDFNFKNGDLYGSAIVEETKIPLETMGEIAIQNMIAVAPDAKVTTKEYRNVNGLEVLSMTIEATIQGIEFTYYGYYYSNDSGTIQLITFTSRNLMKKYKNKAEELLNGITTYN